MLSYIKLLSGQDLKLHEVNFTYTKPENTFEYERIFKCKVLFQKPSNALIFDSELLNIPVIEPNKKLLLLFEQSVQEVLEALNNNNTYTNMVTETILGEIGKCSLPSIKTVANKLLLSVRNL